MDCSTSGAGELPVHGAQILSRTQMSDTDVSSLFQNRIRVISRSFKCLAGLLLFIETCVSPALRFSAHNSLFPKATICSTRNVSNAQNARIGTGITQKHVSEIDNLCN